MHPYFQKEHNQMTTDPVRIAIIVGSTREGRFGDAVGAWFRHQASLRNDISFDYLDLAGLDIPAVYPERATSDIDTLVERIDRADGYVIVTPEYNHGYPASLKQAIDLASSEWRAKPAGFVSYGGMAGGLRAVEQLRQVLAELHVVTIRDTVSFHMAHRQFNEHGELVDPDGANLAAAVMLDQLVWWAETLRDARAVRPYAAA